MNKHKKKIIEHCIQKGFSPDDARVFCRAAFFNLRQDEDYNDIYLMLIKEKFDHLKDQNDRYDNRVFLSHLNDWAEQASIHHETLRESR
jgi:hypothetical protein